MSLISVKHLRTHFPQIAFMDKKGESYLDSASSSLKLDLAIKVLKQFYEEECSNVHRGEHFLSLQATKKYEEARLKVARFLGAKTSSEIIFNSGTTEGLNFLAETLKGFLNPGDQILVTEMEHHSNFLPWKALAKTRNVELKVAPVTFEGELDEQAFKNLLNPKTKIVALTHVSNVTGVINPLERLIPLVRKTPAFVVVDAAQSASFLPLDVKSIDCDFLVFSGHKVFSPGGIGVLYGKQPVLKKLPPYKRGGGTIFKVSLKDTDWADSPHKFEAGTPFIEGALALGEILSFLKQQVDFKAFMSWEQSLVEEAENLLSKIPGLKVLGPKNNRSNILSFVIEGIYSNDLALILGKQKLALRAGHHCCMPLMQKMGFPGGVVRASFSVYNRKQDVEALQKGLLKAIDILKS